MRSVQGEVLLSDHAIAQCFDRGIDPDRVIELLHESHFQQRSDPTKYSNEQVRMDHYFPADSTVVKVITTAKADHELVVTVFCKSNGADVVKEVLTATA
jgi:hypothetical protein